MSSRSANFGSSQCLFWAQLDPMGLPCMLRSPFPSLQGSPTFQMRDECEFVFVWRTVEACPVVRVEGKLLPSRGTQKRCSGTGV